MTFGRSVIPPNRPIVDAVKRGVKSSADVHDCCAWMLGKVSLYLIVELLCPYNEPEISSENLTPSEF